MTKLKPIHALIAISLFMVLIMVADQFARGRRAYSEFERVRPEPDGVVRIGVGDLERLEVRFYRFLNAGNQEVRFLVGRDDQDVVQVGFDANDTHYKTRRGFSYQDGWIIDNKCETTSKLSAINEGGRGCKPVAIKHRIEGDTLLIAEDDMLAGWRYFR